MLISELYARIMALLTNSVGLPSSLPLIGDLSDFVTQWAEENPARAEEVADKLYRLLKEYEGG